MVGLVLQSECEIQSNLNRLKMSWLDGV